MPGMTVRAVHYEIISGAQMARTELPQAEIDFLATSDQVAVLRCVNGGGEKLTAMGDAGRFRELLASGEAADPAGMKLLAHEFPVVVEGWLQAS